MYKIYVKIWLYPASWSSNSAGEQVWDHDYAVDLPV